MVIKEAFKKFKKQWKLVIGLDLSFFAILYLLGFLFQKFFESTTEIIKAKASDFEAIKALNIKIIIGSIILLILIILAWSIIKGILWHKLLHKKPNKMFFLKFFGINLVITILGVIVLNYFGLFIQYFQNEINILTINSLIFRNILFGASLLFIILPLFLILNNIISLFYIALIKNNFKKIYKRLKLKYYTTHLLLGILTIIIGQVSNIFNLFNEWIAFILSTLLLITFFAYNKFIVLEIEDE